MLRTPICDKIGIDHPIVCAPLGPDLSGPELAAAISNAGGLGMLRAPDQERPDRVIELIRRTRELTSRPFGIGVVLSFPHEENVKAALEQKIAVIQVYWGVYPKEKVEEAHRYGAKVIHQVGTVEEARRAADAGVDVIQAQGYEAGGHVIGQVSTMALVPRVVDAVHPVPVIAAGGIADARGLVAALALGAEGVAMGTRFVATIEANAHPTYKLRLVKAVETSTQYTDLFGRARWPGAPHRCLRTPLVEEWEQRREEVGDEARPDQPLVGKSIIHGKEVSLPRFSGVAPNISASGDIDSMALYAGQGVGLIREIQPAATVVLSLVEGANAIINSRLQGLVSGSDAKSSSTMV